MSSLDEWTEYLRSFPPRDAGFVESKHAVACLPEQTAAKLRDAVLAAPHVPISNDAHPEAIVFPLGGAHLEKLNEQHVYKAFDEPTGQALVESFDLLKDGIAGLLNSPWRILNVRSWATMKPSQDFGPNDWHTDEDLPEILKMMIYSSETGGIELANDNLDAVKEVSGFGACVIFYNSVVVHRGIVGSGTRVATEITIAPSREFDLRPFTLGQVARRPLRP